MAEINKPDYSFLWSSGGSTVAPSNVKIQTGWTAEVPPFQWENWAQNRQDQAIAHILQHGISVWDSATEYQANKSYVTGSDGNVYRAVQTNINQNPTTDATDTYWKLAFIDTTSLAQSGPIVGNFLNLRMTVSAASSTATMTADSVVVGIGLNGTPFKLTSVSKSINLGTVGAGGMDTGLAPVSGFISLYLIYNPLTAASALLACNQTTSSGTVYTGGNMPSGYTASALVSAWGTNAGGLLQVGAQLGRQVSITQTQIVSTTVNQANIPASLAGVVPLVAKTISGVVQSGSSATATCTMLLAATVTGIGTQGVVAATAPASSILVSYSGVMLATPQTVYYTCNASVGALVAYAGVTSYTF